MKRSELRTLIREQIINLMEDEGSQASVEAKKKGYHSAGWGRWADRSGKIVAKTVDGKLTPVNIKTDKDAYEPAKGITPDDTNMSPRDKWGGSRPAPGSSSDVTMAKLAPKSYKAGPNGRFHARNVSG